MPVRSLLLDGYNLLHAAGFARVRYAPGDLERSRDRLIALLASGLSPALRQRTTLVFDAFEPPMDVDERPSRGQQLGLSIVFATHHGDADATIEALLAAQGSNAELLLVSADQRLIKAARRRRVQSATSDEFLESLGKGEFLEDRSQRTAEKVPVRQHVAENDVAMWMQEFGEIDVAQLEVSKSPVTPPTAYSSSTTALTPLPPAPPAPRRVAGPVERPAPVDAVQQTLEKDVARLDDLLKDDQAMCNWLDEDPARPHRSSRRSPKN